MKESTPGATSPVNNIIGKYLIVIAVIRLLIPDNLGDTSPASS
jgi:hypothetical protein